MLKPFLYLELLLKVKFKVFILELTLERDFVLNIFGLFHFTANINGLMFYSKCLFIIDIDFIVIKTCTHS